MNEKLTYCERCEAFRPFETVDRIVQMTVKGQSISAPQKISTCKACGENVWPDEFDDFNTHTAHNAYRNAVGSITRERIQELLDRYNITPYALCNLLTWGPNTIERQMKHTVPAKEHARRLESLFDPREMRKLIDENGSAIPSATRKKVEAALIADEIELLNKFSFQDIKATFGLPGTRDKSQKVAYLRRLAGVDSLCNIPNLENDLAVACSMSEGDTTAIDEGALEFWIQVGMAKAEQIKCGSFNGSKLENSLEALRACTANADCVVGVAQATQVLLECGIRAVYVPYIPRMKAYGLVVWKDGTPTIIVSEKRKRIDTLWFALFHEIGHIIMHGDGYVCLKVKEESFGLSLQEGEADQFARNTLIPVGGYEAFVKEHTSQYGRFMASSKDVTVFAGHIGIGADCVIGRLGRDGYIEPSSSIWNSRTRICIPWS